MKKTDKKKCHVLMAIDASGSMGGLVSDVTGGFNQYLMDLYNDPDTKYRITVALFNTDVWKLCDGTKPGATPVLDGGNYRPSGGTALYDAVGELVGNFRERDNASDGTDRVLVVVHTDGEENSSREWTLDGIKQLIKDRQATGRWGFVFLGAGTDKWQQGAHLGFAAAQTVNTGSGTRGSYSGLSHGTVAYAGGTASAQDVSKMSQRASAAADAKENTKDDDAEGNDGK